MSIAIIKTGGKQYLVKEGDKIKVEKLNAKEGDKISFDGLLISDETGEKLNLGKPLVDTKIEGKILKQDRADKILVIKFKNKVRYRRKVGHRQPFSLVEIAKI